MPSDLSPPVCSPVPGPTSEPGSSVAHRDRTGTVRPKLLDGQRSWQRNTSKGRSWIVDGHAVANVLMIGGPNPYDPTPLSLLKILLGLLWNESSLEFGYNSECGVCSGCWLWCDSRLPAFSSTHRSKVQRFASASFVQLSQSRPSTPLQQEGWACTRMKSGWSKRCRLCRDDIESTLLQPLGYVVVQGGPRATQHLALGHS